MGLGCRTHSLDGQWALLEQRGFKGGTGGGQTLLSTWHTAAAKVSYPGHGTASVSLYHRDTSLEHISWGGFDGQSYPWEDYDWQTDKRDTTRGGAG